MTRALARDPKLHGELEDLLVRSTCASRYAEYLGQAAEIMGRPRPSLIRTLEARVRAVPAARSTIHSTCALASFRQSEVPLLLSEPFFGTFDRRDIQSPLVAAGHTTDPTSIPFLIEVLLDTRRSEEQRVAAADALGRLGDVRLLDPFVRLRLDSPFPAGHLGLDQPAWN